MNKLFSDNLESILRTVVITPLAYFSLILLLRVSGKRTLAKMNAFDFVVTIAPGSKLATVVLHKSVALTDGVLAFARLIGLQLVITYTAVRSKTLSKLVKSTPSLLVSKDRLLRDALRAERVNEDEIFSVVRQSGLGSVEDAGAVVLEADGSQTLVKSLDRLETPTLQPIQQPPSIFK